ncbi:MAG: maleylpyruvate isomerase family mycothiol-dependent enzyme, partial [Brevibacterium aurantiacum]
MSETVDWWSLIHAERARLVKLLETLESDQWSADTLCSDWSVEQVVAHLSAAANTGRWAWIRSIVAAGFNADRHNSRLLARFRGRSPEEALGIFRTCITATIVPT